MRGKPKKPRFISLQHKILAFTLLLVMVPLFALGLISYMKSSEIVTQKVGVSDLNTVGQIGNNLELMIAYIQDTSLFLIQNEEMRGFLKLPSSAPRDAVDRAKANTEQLLAHLLSNKAYVDSVYIQGFNGVAIDTKAARKELEPGTIERLTQRKGGGVWEAGEVVKFDGKPVRVLSYMRIVKDINNLSDDLGVLKINLNVDELAGLFANQQVGRTETFYLTDEKHDVIAASAPDAAGTPLSAELAERISTLNAKQGYDTVSVRDETYLLTSYRIAGLGWNVIHQVPLKELLKDNTVIPQLLLVTAVVTFLVCAVFAYLFSKRIILPVKRLGTLMGFVEEENFDMQANVSGNDEIAQLGRSFNKMVHRLKELVSEVYTAQIRRKEAELKALQAQINPHFLYNTLDTIYWMSRMERAFGTAQLVESLSKLFRLSLNSGRELTTVRQETEHLRHYIVIQQKRYEDMIAFQLDVAEEALPCQTVKLILQPLVENAIVHGIEKKGGDGTVRVAVYKDNEQLVFEVADDGAGADLVELERLLIQAEEENRGFGIKNVNDRIQLYFGERYGLEFVRNDAGGTTVFVRQPWEVDNPHDPHDDRG